MATIADKINTILTHNASV